MTMTTTIVIKKHIVPILVNLHHLSFNDCHCCTPCSLLSPSSSSTSNKFMIVPWLSRCFVVFQVFILWFLLPQSTCANWFAYLHYLINGLGLPSIVETSFWLSCYQFSNLCQSLRQKRLVNKHISRYVGGLKFWLFLRLLISLCAYISNDPDLKAACIWLLWWLGSVPCTVLLRSNTLWPLLWRILLHRKES